MRTKQIIEETEIILELYYFIVGIMYGKPVLNHTKGVYFAITTHSLYLTTLITRLLTKEITFIDLKLIYLFVLLQLKLTDCFPRSKCVHSNSRMPLSTNQNQVFNKAT